MALQWLLNNDSLVLDLDLTIEEVMADLDPGWNSSAWTAPGEAADVAALLAVLA